MSEHYEFKDDHSTWHVYRGDGVTEPKFMMTRMGRGIENMDREFDIAYWQELGCDAIMRASWELVELYLRTKGRDDELRLQRSVGGFKRIRRKLPGSR